MGIDTLMSLLKIVCTMLSIALLYGGSVALANEEDYAFLINYAHDSNGVFKNTTLTNFSGKLEGSTTIDDGTNRTEKSLNLSFDSFSKLWGGIQDISSISSYIVTNPDQPIDPKICHVIGITYQLNGNSGTATYCVPIDIKSMEFEQWLNIFKSTK